MATKHNAAESAPETPTPTTAAPEHQPSDQSAKQPPQSLTPNSPPMSGDSQADARQPGDEPPDSPKREYQPVRSWTTQVDGPVKYRRFTDDKLAIIGFKFDLPPNEKLPDDVLALMRDNKQDKDGAPTGLTFKDTRKHGKIWTLPNDAEGRVVADRIDFRLSEIAHKTEPTPGQTPF